MRPRLLSSCVTVAHISCLMQVELASQLLPFMLLMSSCDMQDKQDLQQLQLAATILAVSRAGSLYPGLETTLNPPVPSHQTPDSSSAVDPTSLANALEAASASDKADDSVTDKSVQAVQPAAIADESSAPAQAAAAVQKLSIRSEAASTQSARDHAADGPDKAPAVSHVSHELVPETAVNSPRAAPGSPKAFSHAGIAQSKDC